MTIHNELHEHECANCGEVFECDDLYCDLTPDDYPLCNDCDWNKTMDERS